MFYQFMLANDYFNIYTAIHTFKETNFCGIQNWAAILV